AAVLAGLSWLGEQGEAMVLAAAEANRGVERDERGTGAFAVVFGALLAFIGFPGVFAADAIKAAISRERELLADSASVQYLRDPAGAECAMFALTLGGEPKSRQQACDALKTRRGGEWAARATAMQVEVSAVGRRSMLMLAELAVPAIKGQPQNARDAFIADL